MSTQRKKSNKINVKPKNTLVIVESPAKCKKIEEYLGVGYTCLASFGHFREIRTLKDIDVDSGFTIHFTQQTEKIKRTAVKHLHDAVSKADIVVLATDDDREGEAIAWHLCEVLKLDISTTPRIIFHEITRTAVVSAMQKPSRVNMDLVLAQHSRQVIDMLVGFKISPMLWTRLTYGKTPKGSLSAGRCQTPCLRIVYDNYLRIEEQAKGGTETAYKVHGIFTSQKLQFTLSRQFQSLDECRDFLSSTANDESVHEHLLTRSVDRKVVKKAPVPLTTSRFQQLCSNECSLSPKDAMYSAQKLYEQGYITYMRTDAKRYSADFIDSVSKYITNKYNDSKYVSPTIHTLSGGSSVSSSPVDPQQAHESIRPTSISLEKIPDDADNTETLTPRDKRIYTIIWRNAMESCMADAVYSKYTCKLTSPLPDAHYARSVETPVFLGWEIVASKKSAGDEGYVFLRALEEGKPVPFIHIRAEGHVERPIQHHTEARLVQILEEKGIGRPSTFSSLVDKIQDRGYVKKMNVDGQAFVFSDLQLDADTKKINKKTREAIIGNEKSKLVIQPLGILVVEYLIKHFSQIFNYEYTSRMEEQLESVSSGSSKWTEPCAVVNNDIDSVISSLPLEESSKMCVSIDEEHSYIIGKYGPVIKREVKKNPSRKNSKKEVSFLPVRDDIDMDKLIAGELKLDDIVSQGNEKCDTNASESTDVSDSNANHMMYDGYPVTVKKSKYGLYAVWNGITVTLRGFGNRPPENIRLDEISDKIEAQKSGKVSTIIRELDKNTSVRTSKTGSLYIFYKTPAMKKPNFIKMPKGVTKDNLHEYTEAELLDRIDL